MFGFFMAIMNKLALLVLFMVCAFCGSELADVVTLRGVGVFL
jgi:hypothetical protein